MNRLTKLERAALGLLLGGGMLWIAWLGDRRGRGPAPVDGVTPLHIMMILGSKRGEVKWQLASILKE